MLYYDKLVAFYLRASLLCVVKDTYQITIEELNVPQDLQSNSQLKTITLIDSTGENTVKTDANAELTTQTECQVNPKSPDCKTNIMGAADMMTLIFVPAILLILLGARFFKANTVGNNFVLGVVILIITLGYSIVIGTYDLSEYLTEYPSVLAVVLFGASFGVNLISPFFTEQVIEKPKDDVAEDLPAIEVESKSFVEQIENLSRSLDEAAEASKELITIQKNTENERDEYKKTLRKSS